ncbi:MAG: rod shape-determining protein RodA [Bacteroidales bacterium]|nr:rod shape-determining protein RodA [Bacteroidales bacterium]
MSKEHNSIFAAIDRPTVIIYLLLLIVGWFNIYSASYDYSPGFFLDFEAHRTATMQLIWIGVGLVTALCITLIDSSYYSQLAYIIYGCIILLLIATIFIAPDTKGSHSWLYIGPVAIQPAEFGKFATSLAVAKMLSEEGFKLNNFRSYLRVGLLILLPIGIIVLQQETGSALVYFSFILVLYRRGLPGLIPVLGAAAILLFILVIKYSGIPFLESNDGELGVMISMFIVFLISLGLLIGYRKDIRLALIMLVSYVGIVGLIIAIDRLFVALPLNTLFTATTAIAAVFLVVWGIATRRSSYAWIGLFIVSGIAFCLFANYFFEHILQNYQQMRIKVAFGMEDDPRGVGYNVNQSKIAIGSGGLLGKGFLHGTQTKLKYVPEQATDFIFCTIGEEYGFVGCLTIIVLYAALLMRLITLAERQHQMFAQVYGYCVVGIILFHLIVNIGMVLGLTPVIGIPLPFLSYGGSSMLSFTLLIWIFLRLNANEQSSYSAKG